MSTIDKGFDSEYSSGGLKTELTLALPGTLIKLPAKRGYTETVDLNVGTCCSDDESSVLTQSSSSKVQVVGWPPVRSFRKRIMKNSGKYVKVAVDGAPYLRKVDLENYSGYKELLSAFEDMFTSLLTISSSSSSSSDNDDDVLKKMMMMEYVPTYEDGDGDWMLVGDVPWKMFVQSCKRLRMMKSSEAIGLAASRTMSSEGSNIN